MRYVQFKRKDRPIYDNIDEFRLDYPDEEVLEWRKCRQEGDWVKTDDGTICEVFRIGFFNHTGYNKNIKYVQTVYGSFLVTDRMEGEPKDDKTMLFKERSKPKKPELLFAGLIIKGFTFDEACLIAFGRKRQRRLFRKKSVMKALQKASDDKLADAGFDDDYILEKIKGLIDNETNPASVRSDLLKTLGKARGLFGKEGDVQAFLSFRGFSKDELDKFRNDDAPDSEMQILSEKSESD